MIEAGQTAVVTAGANGIGRRVSSGLAARGMNVVIADINAAATEQAAAEIRAEGGNSFGVACDVRDEDTLQAVRAAALREYGPVQLLVNNVGAPLIGPVEQVPISDWEWLLDVNLLGMVRGLRVFLPDMLTAGAGQVVFTASALALFAGHPIAGYAVPYITSKGAVIALAQSAHQYLAPHGIGVTLFAPEHTDTAFPRSGRVVGGAAALPAVPNPYPPQTPEQAAQVLFAALESGDFLASATPGFAEMLAHQAATRLDPGALTARYGEMAEQPT